MRKLFKIICCIAIACHFSTGAFGQTISSDSSYFIVNKIIIVGNNKTKDHIIHRELLFIHNDTIRTNELENILKKSKENLFNTSLFNFITINSVNEGGAKISLYILLEERWYLWPYPILEYADRNFSSFLHEKDWSRINYGLMVTKYNFRGRRETLKVKARFGYKKQFQFYYDNPFIFNSKNHGMSIEFSWYRQNETSVKTEFDELQFYQDSNTHAKNYHTSFLTYKYRNLHYTKHELMLGYTYINILDTVAVINPNYLGNGNTKTNFITLRYSISHDKRNYKHYATTGYDLKGYFQQQGLSLLNDELPGIWSIGISAYKYLKISKNWYSGIGGNVKLSTNKNQPFFTQRALGYEDYLRAYEYNVIDGQYFFTTRTFIKYAIIPLNIQHISSIGWKKFNKIHYSIYVNAFFDSGYVKNSFNHESNTLPNSYLFSGGIGIDFVTYYDQIIRLEYSINRDKQHGFFIHIGKAF